MKIIVLKRGEGVTVDEVSLTTGILNPKCIVIVINSTLINFSELKMRVKFISKSS